MAETKQEHREGEYQFEYKQRLRELSISTLLDEIYNVTNKTQDIELRELLIEFVIENDLVIE